MEEVSGGAAVSCIVPQAVSPEPAWRKGERFSWGDVRCWGEVASQGRGEGAHSLLWSRCQLPQAGGKEGLEGASLRPQKEKVWDGAQKLVSTRLSEFRVLSVWAVS